MGRTTLAVLVAAALVVGATAPGALAASDDGLSVSVEQHDDGTAAVAVTANGTAVANASVTVETTDENATYDGAGNHTTDENGTVGLPAPDEAVNVSVTAASENATATTTTELAAANDTEESDRADRPFGERVSALVHGLQNDSDASGPFGLLVAQFATAENPGNGQGPPATAGPGDDADDRGPPEFAGGDGDGADGDGEERSDDEAGGNAEDAEDADDADDADDEDDDRQRGPPGHARN